MGILQSMRHGFGASSRADAPGSQFGAGDVDAGSNSEARAIVQRQEQFAGTVDAIADLAAQLDRMTPMVQKLRQPMTDEFESYRRAHAELAYLKNHTATVEATLAESRASESALQEAIRAHEDAVAQTRLENEQLRLSSEAATLELIQQRESLARALASARELGETAQASSTRCVQLEEDCTTLRMQIDQAAERRRELDAIVARVRQEALLSSEESGTLRRKVEELAERNARAARAEGQAQAEAAKDRERSLVHRAEAERAQTDLTALAHEMDEQASAAGREIGTLSTQVETLTARNGKLERIVGDLNVKLGDSAAQRRVAEARASDLQLGLDRAHEKAAHLERTLAELRSGHEQLDRARLTALERGDQVALSVRTQEIALQRSEQRLALLQDKHAAAAAEMEQLRRAHDDERGRMLSETKRLEAELNLLRGGSSKPASQRIVSEEETTQLSEAG